MPHRPFERSGLQQTQILENGGLQFAAVMRGE
jgi:hypothetical protein